MNDKEKLAACLAKAKAIQDGAEAAASLSVVS